MAVAGVGRRPGARTLGRIPPG